MGCFCFLCSRSLSSIRSLSKFFYPLPSTPTELPGPLAPHCSAMEIQLLVSSGSNQLILLVLKHHFHSSSPAIIPHSHVHSALLLLAWLYYARLSGKSLRVPQTGVHSTEYLRKVVKKIMCVTGILQSLLSSMLS